MKLPFLYRSLWFVFGLLLLLISKSEALDINLFHPIPGFGKIVTVDTAEVGTHLAVSPELFLHYSYQPNASVDVFQRFRSDLGFSFAAWRRLQIGFVFPITWYQNGDRDGRELVHIGPEDLRFSIKGILWNSTLSEKYKNSEAEGGIGLLAEVTAPTGDPNNYMGSGGASSYVIPASDTSNFIPRAIGSGLPSLRFNILGHVRYRHLTAAVNVGAFVTQANISSGLVALPGILYHIGLEYTVIDHEKTALRIFAEISGLSHYNFTVGSINPCELLIGAKYNHTNWIIFAGLGFGLVNAYDAPLPRIFAGFSWAYPIPPKRVIKPKEAPPIVTPLPTQVIVPPPVSGSVAINGRKIVTSKAFFATGKDIARLEDYAVLDEIAALLESRPDLKKIRIEGHTDDQGNLAHNLSLSQRRADFIKHYLIHRGIRQERLLSKGFGALCPLIPKSDPDSRAVNRRVEFIIVEQEGLPSLPIDSEKCTNIGIEPKPRS